MLPTKVKDFSKKGKGAGWERNGARRDKGEGGEDFREEMLQKEGREERPQRLKQGGKCKRE